MTALRARGFFLEDPLPDADPRTSEAIFVHLGARPAVRVGDAVRVSGRVVEWTPGGRESGNLSVTEIDDARVEPGPADLPPVTPTRIGERGRRPPASDALGFFESLEAMLVTIEAPVAIGPSRGAGRVAVLARGSEGASDRTARGSLLPAPDGNPERLLLAPPTRRRGALRVDVGDRLEDVTGVVEYRFGRYEIAPTAPLRLRARGGLAPEATALEGGPDALSVGTLNAWNLDPGDASARDGDRFARLADTILRRMGGPDVVALQEIEDDDGARDSGHVGAAGTVERLLAALRHAAPKARYVACWIDPEDGADGGEPGGNIRPVLLLREGRVALVERPGGDARTATRVVRGESGPALSPSPGRVAPADPAFRGTRKPLAAELRFGGRTLFVVDVHLSSRRGSDPLFGARQPPRLGGADRRLAQARAVRTLADALLAADPGARLVVLGDFNDESGSPPLAALAGPAGAARLEDLMTRLVAADRYTYVHEGEAAALDHVVVSPALAEGAEIDAVHANAEFAGAPSDHDPVVARLRIPPSPPAPAAAPAR